MLGEKMKRMKKIITTPFIVMIMFFVGLFLVYANYDNYPLEFPRQDEGIDEEKQLLPKEEESPILKDAPIEPIEKFKTKENLKNVSKEFKDKGYFVSKEKEKEFEDNKLDYLDMSEIYCDIDVCSFTVHKNGVINKDFYFKNSGDSLTNRDVAMKIYFENIVDISHSISVRKARSQ